METFYLTNTIFLCLVTVLVIYYIFSWNHANIWFHRLVLVTKDEKVKLSFENPTDKKVKKFSVKIRPQIRQVFTLSSPNTRREHTWYHDIDTKKTFKIVKMPNYDMQHVHSEPYLLSDTDAYTVSTIPERWIHLFMIENSLQSQEEVKVELSGYEYCHEMKLHTPRSPFEKLNYTKSTPWITLPYTPRIEYYKSKDTD